MTKRQFQIVFISINCILLFSCNSSKLSKETGLPKFSKVANCGSVGMLAETNVSSFIHAIDAGATAVQFRVVQNRDKELLISGESLKSSDKLRFRELIDSVRSHFITLKRPPLQYIIVLKDEQMKDGIANAVMKVVNDESISADVIIASLDIKTLQEVHKKNPEIRIALIARGDSQSSFRKQLKDLGFVPGIYEAENILVNEALVKDCRSRGISIFAWTVDDKDQIRKLMSMGVDGIVTDYPDYF